MNPPIDVRVRTEYLATQSQPARGKFAFAYHITVTNQGGESATLLHRHWIITDGNGGKREVRGEGVVGEQPTIAPGDSYRYSSFAVLDTTVGTMEGSYEMALASGEQFLAPIRPFRLAVPGAIN